MEAIMTFKRYELKYKLTKQQYFDLKNLLEKYATLDQFGKHTIHNIYFDTDDYLLIRRSIEKPDYKEKLRIRSYGYSDENSQVFIELKKKFKGVVYKRRVALAKKEAIPFAMGDRGVEHETQITREIDYFREYYDDLKPALLLSYDREAYISNDDESLRITFDTNVMSRQDNVLNLNEVYGHHLLDDNTVLLEIKTTLGLPSWLLKFFSENGIYKTSFSKYGNAYKQYILPKTIGGYKDVV